LYDEAAKQPAYGRKKHQQPRPKRSAGGTTGKGLSMCSQRNISGHLFEDKTLGELETRKERRTHETCRDPNQCSVQDDAPRYAQIERGRIGEGRGKDRTVRPVHEPVYAFL
jgi:hypothetical protein